MDEVYAVERLEQLRVLADPHRLQILRQLMLTPATITQIGRRLGEEPSKVRYHVKELERVGLAHMVEKREKGGALEKYYQAVARNFTLNITVLAADGRESDVNALTLRMMSDLTTELSPGLHQPVASEASPGGWPAFHGIATAQIGPAQADAFVQELRGLLERFKARDDVGAPQHGLLALLYRAPQGVAGTIVAIGSHDLTLDLLARRLAEHPSGLMLHTTNVGSLGGLMALHRGAAHLAGCHLLDPESGEYNVPYVSRLLPGQPVVVVNLAYREQGLMLLPGNPKGIAGLGDLMRPDVVFVNRERGSGTRVLLDRKLREAGIDPARIRGYEREEFTHLAVAGAVAGGRADAGLGILAAARTYGLDFRRLARERFDLIIPRGYYESELLQPLLALLRSPSLRQEIEALGGYDASLTGQVLAELEG